MRGNQTELVAPFHFFYGYFALRGRTAAMARFDENDLAWLTASEILRALTLSMLLKTSAYIGRDASIKAAVATRNDINRPGHIGDCHHSVDLFNQVFTMAAAIRPMPI